MTIRIQKLTFWFYIWFFCSLSYLSSLGISLNQPSIVILTQLVLFLIFLGISLMVLSKRQKEIKELKKAPSFQALYRREIITACVVAFSMIDIFFLTNISKLIYLIAVFYHLYWFIKNYSLSTTNNK